MALAHDVRPLCFGGEDPRLRVLETIHRESLAPDRPAFVRLVLHPDDRWNGPWLDHWALRIAALLARGVDAWMMIHCPNNLYCPTQARDFHERLRARLGSLAPAPLPPPWPAREYPIPEERS